MLPAVTWYESLRANTCASVLLPEPFGPMMEWTSPALIVRSMPFRISCPPTSTRRLLTSSKLIPHLTCQIFVHGISADAAFQAHAQQLLRLDRKLHRQFAKHPFAEAIDNH